MALESVPLYEITELYRWVELFPPHTHTQKRHPDLKNSDAAQCMPRTGYDNCVKIMVALLKRDFEKQVPVAVIEQAIKKEVGTDHRTVEKYKRDLVDLGFLEPVNTKVYEIRQSPYVYEGYRDELQEVADRFEDVIGPLPDA